MPRRYLTIPADWLDACGLGRSPASFPVTACKSYGLGKTFATIELSPWHTLTVWVELRNAVWAR